MPIQINLLAERLAIEEERRKDPVKKAIIFASAVVALFVLWAVAKQVTIFRLGSQVKVHNLEFENVQAKYEQLTADQKVIQEYVNKLKSLNSLSTNRFLWANVLNALQQLPYDEMNIVVTRIVTKQTYNLTKGKIGDPNSDDPIKRATIPDYMTEKRDFLVEARDYSTPAGGQVAEFRRKLYALDYISNRVESADSVRLIGRSAEQPDPIIPGARFVLFTVSVIFPDEER